MTPQSIRSARAYTRTNKCITIVYHRNKQYLHIRPTNPLLPLFHTVIHNNPRLRGQRWSGVEKRTSPPLRVHP